MKKSLIAVTAAAVALLAAPAMAQDSGVEWYGNVGYSHYDFDGVDLGGIQGRVGARVHRYFGIEGEAAIGVKDDSFAGVDVELNHSLGIYAVAFLPVTDSVDLIARAGYSNTEIGIGGADIDDDSFNYGVGAQWSWDGTNAIRGDYTRFDGDAAEADVWSLSYVRKF